MPTTMQWAIHAAAVLIEFGGGLFVVMGCLKGLAALTLAGAGKAAIICCRLYVGDGVIAALGYKTAVTLLKPSNCRLGRHPHVRRDFALRTFVKQFLVWEERRLHV